MIFAGFLSGDFTIKNRRFAATLTPDNDYQLRRVKRSPIFDIYFKKLSNKNISRLVLIFTVDARHFTLRHFTFLSVRDPVQSRGLPGCEYSSTW